jgi:hypothetical protein
MNCEHCGLEHDGSYASGRFCSPKCSRTFSTASKREEINTRVSEKLQGRESVLKGRKQSREIVERRLQGFTPEKRKEAGEKVKQLRYDDYARKSFDELSYTLKKRRVKDEQNDKCNRCGLSEWLELPIALEIEHKDGNNSNNSRENLEALCPNCHAQTPTWRKSRGAKQRICEALVVKR